MTRRRKRRRIMNMRRRGMNMRMRKSM